LFIKERKEKREKEIPNKKQHCGQQLSPRMADMVAHGSSGAEVGLPAMASPREHKRREALADDPTPEYLKGAPLHHSADEIRPGLYLSGTLEFLNYIILYYIILYYIILYYIILYYIILYK
jgi:hypothetical protein